MGREVKRVPFDFDWPQYQRWEGYQAPEGKQYEPPKGPGWQMWTTTDEAPMSPVFKTPEQLADWLTDTKASAFAHQKASREEWLAMIRSEKPSLTGVLERRTGNVQSGVAYSAQRSRKLKQDLASRINSNARRQEKDPDRERD